MEDINSVSKWTGIGAFGGWVCGSVVLSIGGLLGKSGSTGEEYLGFWTPAYLGLSLFYAAPVGAFFSGTLRAIFSHLNDSFLLEKSWILAGITILFGSVGALTANPFVILIISSLSFLSAFIILAMKGKS